MTSYRTIRYERTDAVGVLTLARPEKRNAQNPVMWQELRALGEALTDDPDLRCLIVRGDGNSFSAGIDLVEGLGTVAAWTDDPQDQRNHAEGALAASTFRWIPRMPWPSVAAVQGHAYGAGLQLALSCDFRIFAASARVGLIETRFGLLPDMGATARLPRIVGEGRARELILLGEVIDAQEAARIGLANRVVDDADIDAAARQFSERLAAQPPIAIRGARRALDASWHLDADAAFTVALDEQFACLTSDDFKEGLAALRDGRDPTWQGR
jgi:enoyl-CoA hydratase/carnithine racemase